MGESQSWYDELDITDGEQTIYRIAKERHKKILDLEDVEVIRNRNANIIVEIENIKRR